MFVVCKSSLFVNIGMVGNAYKFAIAIIRIAIIRVQQLEHCLLCTLKMYWKGYRLYHGKKKLW